MQYFKALKSVIFLNNNLNDLKLDWNYFILYKHDIIPFDYCPPNVRDHYLDFKNSYTLFSKQKFNDVDRFMLAYDGSHKTGNIIYNAGRVVEFCPIPSLKVIMADDSYVMLVRGKFYNITFNDILLMSGIYSQEQIIALQSKNFE